MRNDAAECKNVNLDLPCETSGPVWNLYIHDMLE